MSLGKDIVFFDSMTICDVNCFAVVYLADELHRTLFPLYADTYRNDSLLRQISCKALRYIL